MRIRIQKWFSLGLVITLTLSGLLIGGWTAQANETNLLLNGSFEQGLEQWGVWKEMPEKAVLEVVEAQADVHDGAKAIKAGGHSGVSVTQYVTDGFAPGDAMTLSYWGKLDQGTSDWSLAQVSVRALKGAEHNADELYQYKLEMDKSNVYKPYTHTFTVPADTMALEVSFYVYAADTRENYAWVDQIGLTAQAPTSPELPQTGTSGDWNELTYKSDPAGIDTNPLKGLVPFSWQGQSPFPHSMEWFYIPLKDIMTGYTTFDWTKMEENINAITARGNQAIARVYLDFPMRETGTPQFLIDDGVAMRDYTVLGNQIGQSKAPDWNNEKLIDALSSFIAAFGAKYDGDPRIGFIQTGIYGFWGEWHTYPMEPGGNPDNIDWRMSQTNKDKLLKAFKDAFKQSIVITRDPSGTTDESLKHDFGYFDDSFAHYTIGDSWYFWPRMVDNGLAENWKTHPMGGEMNPAIMDDIFKSWSQPGLSKSKESWAQEADLETSIRTTHASWIANYVFFNKALNNELTEEEKANALKAHRLIGYELFVSKAKLHDARPDGPLQAYVKIRNKGLAPFAADWPAAFAALGKDGTMIPLGTQSLQLKDIQPGDEDGRAFIQASHSLAEGSYKLLMQVNNPMPGGHPLTFANAEQHADQEGWLTLGSFAVSASAAADTEPPAAPGKPQASDVTANGLTLSWTPSTDDVEVAGYEIYRGSERINTESVLDNRFVATGLAPDTEYSFTIKAVDAAGRTSIASEPLVVKTAAESGPGPDPGPIPGDDTDPAGTMRLEAENFSSFAGSVRAFKNKPETGAGGAGLAGWTKNGDTIQFDAIDFGDGYNQLTVRYATEFEGGTLEMLVDTADGPVIGKVLLPPTGGWGAPDNWNKATVDLATPLKGSHAVIIKFINPAKDGVCDLDWIRFGNKSEEPGTGTGGGGTPPANEPVVTKETVLVNGNRQGTAVQAFVSASILAEAAKNAAQENFSQIVLKVNSAAGDSSVTVELPAALSHVSSAGVKSLVLQTALGEADIQLASLRAAVPAGAAKLTLAFAAVDKSKLAKELADAIGNRPFVGLQIAADGTAIPGFDANRPVQLTIPYKLQPGEQAHMLVLNRLSEDGKLVPVPQARYNAAAEAFTFRTRSLHSYALVSKQPTNPAGVQPWAKEAWEAMAARGLLLDEGQTTQPETIARGEVLAMLVRLLELQREDSNDTLVFADTGGSPWHKEIAVAAALGIAKGKNGGTFGANDAITREELAVLVYRALKALELPLDHTAAVEFVDRNAIHNYAQEAVGRLAGAGLLLGNGQSSFAPQRQVTRDEAMVLLYRLIGLQ